MGENRYMGTEGTENVHLARRVTDVVLATDDMADAHVEIVDDNGQIVGRRPIGLADHQVVEFAVLPGNPTSDHVIETNGTLDRSTEADHMRSGGINVTGAAVPVVLGFLLALHLLGTEDIESLPGAVAAVSMPLLKQPIDHFLVTVETLGLEERPFVVLEAEPGHALEDGVDRFRGRAFKVGVLDAQNERAAMATGMKPGEERGTGTTDVEVAGRARVLSAGCRHEQPGRPGGAYLSREASRHGLGMQ